MSEFCEFIVFCIMVALVLPLFDLVLVNIITIFVALLICFLVNKMLKIICIRYHFTQQTFNLLDILISFIICFFIFETKSGVVYIVYLICRSAD